jgi:uncharacterized membrane protein YesL
MEHSNLLKKLFVGFEWITRLASSNIVTCLGIAPILFLGLNLLLAQTEDQVITLIITLFVLSPFLLFPAFCGLFSVVKSWREGNRSLYSYRLLWQSVKNHYKKNFFLGCLVESILLTFGIVLRFTVRDLTIIWGALWVIATFLLLITSFTMISFVEYNTSFREHLLNGVFITLAFPVTNFMLGLFIQISITMSVFYAQFLIPFFLFSGIAFTLVILFEKHLEKVIKKQKYQMNSSNR